MSLEHPVRDRCSKEVHRPTLLRVPELAKPTVLMSSSWQGTRGHLVNSPEAARNGPRCNAAASCCLMVRPCSSCAGSVVLGMSPMDLSSSLCSKQPSEATGKGISLFKNRKGVCMSKKLGLYMVNRELLPVCWLHLGWWRGALLSGTICPLLGAYWEVMLSVSLRAGFQFFMFSIYNKSTRPVLLFKIFLFIL